MKSEDLTKKLCTNILLRLDKVQLKLSAKLSDFCRLCEDVEELESIDNILCHCPRLKERRFKWIARRFIDELHDILDISFEITKGLVTRLSCAFFISIYFFFSGIPLFCSEVFYSQVFLSSDLLIHIYIFFYSLTTFL